MKKINLSNTLPKGYILHGAYRIDGQLSSGTLSNTYAATDIHLGRHVAVKEFFLRGVSERDAHLVKVSNFDNTAYFYSLMKCFKEDAVRLRGLKSGRIPAVLDLFDENGTAYCVMAYTAGESIADRLEHTNESIPEDEAMRILSLTLDALEEAHSTGSILHLDIKPGNIKTDFFGNVKVTDFSSGRQAAIMKGETLPTPEGRHTGYVPREQTEQSASKIGPWTDIYSLGATLYTMLTGSMPPLPSDIDDDTTSDKRTALPFPENVSPRTRDLVLWMMRTNRHDRPQTVSQIRDRLQGMRAAQPHKGELPEGPAQPSAKDDDGTIDKDGGAGSEAEEAEDMTDEDKRASGNSHDNLERAIMKDPAGSIRQLQETAGEQGHAVVQDGHGGIIYSEVCYDEDIKRLRNAAEKGDPDAQYDLGVCYSDGDGVEEDHAEAAKWYRKSAEQGYPEAQYDLATCYHNGDGVEKDPTEAAKWYRKAAGQGVPDALYDLGFCYYLGDGVEQDLGEAEKWWRMAAEQGSQDAAVLLKEHFPQRVTGPEA